MGRPLGKGKFGRVYMVRTRTDPPFVLALKAMYKSEIVASGVEKQTRREIEIQSNLRYGESVSLRWILNLAAQTSTYFTSLWILP